MFGYSSEEERRQAVDRIIKTEWEMFQKVNNIGGRADCQNDWNTFHVMRCSQYSAWTDRMLMSYEKDLNAAVLQGRNLVMEKYAYMMEFTAPDYYRTELAPFLPKVDTESMLIIREITDYLIECEKEIALKYPTLSKAGRTIAFEEDNDGFTSVETYTIGELKTYSKDTLELYLEHIRVNRAADKNIVLVVKSTMVKLYGYVSMEDAESKMQL
ncbi:DUF4125 family protein [Clostridium aminobutyricum]|uniref:DUF4125 family protein n=1 Tax=Clostridium aminobutyricum TaxID=33953 RepID=A0A939D790_CLOAM|nr:DUF4125 family protein [Clostridium aminobutyricum]MBN7772118.1 DUF4125 family protein [Clostridium aminobutyricum]